MCAAHECDGECDDVPMSRKALMQLRRQLLRSLAEVEELLGLEPSVLPRRLRRRLQGSSPEDEI